MSRTTQEQKHKREGYFAYGAITLWGAASQQLPLYRTFVTFAVQVRSSYLTTPNNKYSVWAVPVSLAATKGIARVAFHPLEHIKRTEHNSLLFSVPLGTEMFYFPRFASYHIRVG